MARLEEARFLLVLPNGDVLVSQPHEGKLVILIRRPNNSIRAFDYAEDLRRPHDMVLYTPTNSKNQNNTTYLYVSESHQIIRYEYRHGDRTARGNFTVIVPDLPDDSTDELKGAYRHALKNIAIKDDVLYVATASATNDDPSDLEATIKRGAIYAYPVDGGSGKLFAEGIRNAEGLAFAPDTGDLWAVVNQRDDIKYPYNDDTGLYGKEVQWYIDDNPPEEFIRVTNGSRFGWPYCNPQPTPSMNFLPYIADYERNPNETVVDCGEMTIIDKGIDAHAAPLGLTFWVGTSHLIPTQFNGVAVVALHGSWNRQAYNGHKVVYFPWMNGRPGRQRDLVTGWLTNPIMQNRWGRPVDTAVMPDGSLIISDDWTGAVYRLYKGNNRRMRPKAQTNASISQ